MSRASRHRKSTTYGPIGSCRTNLKLCSLRPRRLLHKRASAGMSARRRERARRIWRRGVKDTADPTCGSTVALCAPALIRPSGTFSHASAWEKGKENERAELKLAPMGESPDDGNCEGTKLHADGSSSDFTAIVHIYLQDLSFPAHPKPHR